MMPLKNRPILYFPIILLKYYAVLQKLRSKFLFLKEENTLENEKEISLRILEIAVICWKTLQIPP